jgi:hypothetical protein
MLYSAACLLVVSVCRNRPRSSAHYPAKHPWFGPLYSDSSPPQCNIALQQKIYKDAFIYPLDSSLFIYNNSSQWPPNSSKLLVLVFFEHLYNNGRVSAPHSHWCRPLWPGSYCRYQSRQSRSLCNNTRVSQGIDRNWGQYLISCSNSNCLSNNISVFNTPRRLDSN